MHYITSISKSLVLSFTVFLAYYIIFYFLNSLLEILHIPFQKVVNFKLILNTLDYIVKIDSSVILKTQY